MAAAVTGLLLAAVGLLLVRAPSPAVVRLRVLHPGAARLGVARLPFRPAGIGLGLPALGGAVALAGWSRLGFGVPVPIVPALAGAVAGGTAAVVLGRASTDRARRRAAAALLESVGALSADLRAGRPAAEALHAAGAGPAAQYPAVAAVWTVSDRSGASAAAVLDRVEEDLRIRLGQRREVDAQLAGARSTAALLAVLPVLGISLGAAMGADPLTVLLGETRGHLALLTGVALDAAGVLWTARIVAAAGEDR